MSGRRRVLRRPRAEQDIEEQTDYYLFEERSPDAAVRFVDGVERSLEVLASQPEIGRVYERARGKLSGLRAWRVSGFRDLLVFYTVTEEAIVIERVVDGRRDIPELLDEEL